MDSLSIYAGLISLGVGALYLLRWREGEALSAGLIAPRGSGEKDRLSHRRGMVRFWLGVAFLLMGASYLARYGLRHW